MMGLNPVKIEVEVDGSAGTPHLIIIGLPSKTVEEARERITCALQSCGIRIKAKRVIVNLAPASLRKNDSTLELAIVVAILKMYGEIENETDHCVFLGELSLDGTIKPMPGALPLALAARDMGFQHIILPQSCLEEIKIIHGIQIHLISHLRQYLDKRGKIEQLPVMAPVDFQPQLAQFELDYAQVRGQVMAKRALEVAAAGGHNILLIGPPGAGKSLMAQTLPSILPPLTEKEAIEVTAIYSVCGLTRQEGLIKSRPFRHPHHSTSTVGLVGGGANLKPGEISLAHRGVLFLDEIPEFPIPAIEALRQPLEDGHITISRAIGSVTYPADFTLVAAANPCACGYFGSLKKNCVCPPAQRSQYLARLSGPIMDRLDMVVRVSEVPVTDLQTQPNNLETSAQVRQRVLAARKKQLDRFDNLGPHLNSNMTPRQIKKSCQLSVSAMQFLTQACQKFNLSARSYFKIIKVSQTIADLQNSPTIEDHHIKECLSYKQITT